jgi:hypothetical protein
VPDAVATRPDNSAFVGAIHIGETNALIVRNSYFRDRRRLQALFFNMAKIDDDTAHVFFWRAFNDLHSVMAPEDISWEFGGSGFSNASVSQRRGRASARARLIS